MINIELIMGKEIMKILHGLYWLAITLNVVGLVESVSAYFLTHNIDKLNVGIYQLSVVGIFLYILWYKPSIRKE